MSNYDVDAIRKAFPALQQEVHGHPLAYLDNAATTQKPRAVLDAVSHYYEHDNANVHRGVHELSERATRAYEGARAKVAHFIGGAPDEVVWTRGTTEAINLVAATHGASLGPGDDIIVSVLEHHSNIVPWQLLAQRTGATIRVIPCDERGVLDVDACKALLGDATKIVSVGHVSNAIGTIHPIEEIVQAAKAVGATTVIDGAQAAPHLPIDVARIGCDFYALSGHKMYGPTGIGALWGRRELLDAMPPYQGGGEMILQVRFDETKYNEVPHKFEAGTPNIAGAVGMGAAVDYLQGIGLRAIGAHEERLLAYATDALSAVKGLKIVGTAPHKAAVVSFTVKDVHPHDIGTMLDRVGVAVRTGHHCAQPAMERFGVPATARASFGLYNTKGEIDRLAAGLRHVVEVFT